MWTISHKTGNRATPSIFETKEEAQNRIKSMGFYFKKHLIPWFVNNENPKQERMINEGLIKNDLEGILLPQISIDVYVPSDPTTDNIVLGFFIKGVPEAVLPLKYFLEYCNGVIDVDYGDSETIKNGYVVYVEMDRESIKISHINDIVIQLSMISNLTPEDFTILLPSTNKKFPYDLKVIERYFKSRNRKKNHMAQKKAQEQSQKQNKPNEQNESTMKEELSDLLSEMISLDIDGSGMR